MKNINMNTRAFSLVELVVVVVILGVLAAMAIPRFSQGAVNQPEDDLKVNLAVLRTAIELYHNEHGVYPGQQSAGGPSAAAGTTTAVIRQLTQYTTAEGKACTSGSEEYCFGPYLQNGIPPCSVSADHPSAVLHLIAGRELPGFTAQAPDAGWIYNYETGYIAANSPGVDDRGIRHDSY